MDKQLEMSAYTFFIERYGVHISKFRNENKRNIAFMHDVSEEKEKIKDLVPADVWKCFNDYTELLSIQSDIACKYVYEQGVKDGMNLSNFLDTKFSDSDFDLLLGCNIPNAMEE